MKWGSNIHLCYQISYRRSIVWSKTQSTDLMSLVFSGQVSVWGISFCSLRKNLNDSDFGLQTYMLWEFLQRHYFLRDFNQVLVTRVTFWSQPGIESPQANVLAKYWEKPCWVPYKMQRIELLVYLTLIVCLKPHSHNSLSFKHKTWGNSLEKHRLTFLRYISCFWLSMSLFREEQAVDGAENLKREEEVVCG